MDCNGNYLTPANHSDITPKCVRRDWSGLAQVVGLEGTLRPYLQQESDKTAVVLKLWQAKDKENATIENLLLHLENLDRFDVIDDIEDLIGNKGFKAGEQEFLLITVVAFIKHVAD